MIEPGTRLAGRYRLDERFRESAGSTLWKATDEILARAVAVRTFSPEFPRIAEVVTAARAASRLTDPRLTQVFDADDSGELAYVVSEWVTGETLEAMVLARGPMDPGRAATLLYEASQALTAAHAAGLTHLRLTPRDLLWTTGNTVKILGLGVDAALAGVTAQEPAATDARGLARMLYAALTAHWPGTGEDADVRGSLPPAPQSNGVTCRPGQVVPGVPLSLDILVSRALGLVEEEPVATPAALAQALQRVPRIPLPIFAGLAADPPPPPPIAPQSRANTTQRFPVPPSQYVPPAAPRHQAPPAPQPYHATLPSQAYSPSRRQPRRDRRALVLVGAAVAAAIVGIGVWASAHSGGGGTKAGSAGVPGLKDNTGPSKAAQPTAGPLVPVGGSGFDPATSGHPDTAVKGGGAEAVVKGGGNWHTQHYSDADFGRLTDGLGLLIDMGKQVTITSVHVTMPAGGAGTLQLRVGNGTSLGALKVVGQSGSAQGSVDITARSGAQGQYVLLWFTKLPNLDGQFMAQINKVTVYGRQGQ
jgi:hypothetical protein